MATFVYTDAFFSIGGTDLSDHVRSLTLNIEAEAVDDTNMGDTTRVNKGGLLNWSLEVEFSQDFASSNVDDTLFATIGAAATFITRADNSDGVGATNPNYTGSALLTGYSPFTGSVGDLATTTASFVPAGAISRATS